MTLQEHQHNVRGLIQDLSNLGATFPTRVTGIYTMGRNDKPARFLGTQVTVINPSVPVPVLLIVENSLS